MRMLRPAAIGNATTASFQPIRNLRPLRELPLFFDEVARAKSLIVEKIDSLKPRRAAALEQYNAPTVQRLNVSTLQLCSKAHLHRAVVLLRRAGRVDRHAGIGGAWLDDLIVDEVFLDFLAAYIGEHFVVNLDAG